jgi:hypothetical protein
MSLIGDKRSKETAERVARQKELAKVVINREDVDLIVSKFCDKLYFLIRFNVKIR